MIDWSVVFIFSTGAALGFVSGMLLKAVIRDAQASRLEDELRSVRADLSTYRWTVERMRQEKAALEQEERASLEKSAAGSRGGV